MQPATSLRETPENGSRNRALVFRKLLEGLTPLWWIWLLLVSVFVLNCIWIAASPNLHFAPGWFESRSLVLIGLACAVAYRQLRVHVFDRLLDTLFKLLMFLIFTVFVKENMHILNCLLTSLGYPIADALLHFADRALGFDWNAYTAAVLAHPPLTKALVYAYGLAGKICFLLGIIFILFQRDDRLNEIAYLGLVTALVCIVIAAFFPAEAAWKTVGDPEILSRFGGDPYPGWLNTLHALRGGEHLFLDPKEMGGLASVPSFHTCLGIVVAWCSRGHWATLAAGSVFGLCVIAATPIFGSHYLVDILAGAIVAIVAISVWHCPWREAKGAARPQLTKL